MESVSLCCKFNKDFYVTDFGRVSPIVNYYEFFNGLFSFFGEVVERKEKKRSHHVVKIQSLT